MTQRTTRLPGVVLRLSFFEFDPNLRQVSKQISIEHFPTHAAIESLNVGVLDGPQRGRLAWLDKYPFYPMLATPPGDLIRGKFWSHGRSHPCRIAVKELERNYTTTKRPADYAQKLNLSTAYLNECVKNATDHSASHYIQQRTILEAKRVLY